MSKVRTKFSAPFKSPGTSQASAASQASEGDTRKTYRDMLSEFSQPNATCSQKSVSDIRDNGEKDSNRDQIETTLASIIQPKKSRNAYKFVTKSARNQLICDTSANSPRVRLAKLGASEKQRSAKVVANKSKSLPSFDVTMTADKVPVKTGIVHARCISGVTAPAGKVHARTANDVMVTTDNVRVRRVSDVTVTTDKVRARIVGDVKRPSQQTTPSQTADDVPKCLAEADVYQFNLSPSSRARQTMHERSAIKKVGEGAGTMQLVYLNGGQEQRWANITAHYLTFCYFSFL